MSKICAIAYKELKEYFKTPLAYLILIITISIFNLFFYIIIDQNREATLRDVFKLMEFMFVFIIPLLTMKIFSEEKAAGTMEFLMTTPTSNTVLVLGKYLGSVLFYSIIVGITGSYYFLIRIFGPIDFWATVSGYTGLWLDGLLFIAIGIFTSSLTKSQIMAAISAYILSFLIYFSISLNLYVPSDIKPIIEYISLSFHTANLFVGIISVSDIVYFVSLSFFFVTLTRLSIENRWR